MGGGGYREWIFLAESFFVFFFYYFINAIISAVCIVVHIDIWHTVTFLLYFDVFFSPPEEYTFGHPKCISSHSFLPRRLKRPSFCRKLNCRDWHTPFFFNIRSLSSKTCNTKKTKCKKCDFLKKKKFICSSNVYYSEIRKNGMWSCALSHGKWNKIIKFVLSVKLGEEIGFLQDPQKAYILYAIRFL